MSTVDKEYHVILEQLRTASEQLLAPGAGVLFVTQARKKLNQHYLLSLRTAAILHKLDDVNAFVQEYTCSTCSKFMARVGHLVIGTDFGVQSIYWNPDVVTDPVFKSVVEAMKRFVEDSRIINVFNPEGPYQHYVENTDLGGKDFRHYYIEQRLLTHRVPVLNAQIDVGRVSAQMDRVNALIRLIGEVNMNTVGFVDGLFQSRVIEHVGAGKETLEQFQALVLAINIRKTQPDHIACDIPYLQETMVINTIWKYAMRHMGLLNLRSSILGELLLRAENILSEGASDNHIQRMTTFWAEKTDGLRFRRTTAPASESQITKTARFLEEGGWMASMEQVEVAEKDVPVIWEAKRAWTFEEAHEPTANGFAAFAEKKGVELSTPSAILPVDLGYFMNEVLPYVEELGLVATGISFNPILINGMANMDAKPIFTWDSVEKRAPFIPWRYNEPFSLSQLKPLPSIVKGREAVLPVLSITTNKAIGYVGRSADDMVFFQFGGISMPETPRPTLFVESMLPEFYAHRRALEDYSKVTMIPRAETQQSISMCFGPRHPRQPGSVPVIIYVRLNEEGKVRFGNREMRYRFDANGWTIAPDLDKYPVITDRYTQSEAEAPAAPVSGGVAVSV